MSTIKNNINTYANLTAYNADTTKDFPNVSYIEELEEVKYSDTVIYVTYNVTSTSSATKLLNSNSSITYQIIDGVKQDTVQTTYTFDTLGEHTVKYKYSVTSIGAYAFLNCTSLTNVTILNGIIDIDNNAFNGCTNLTSITVGDFISQNKFTTTYNINRIFPNLNKCIISKGVTSISNLAFYMASTTAVTNLNITIPNSVTSIGASAFRKNTRLLTLTIPNSVTSIGNYVVEGCTSLTSITVEATTPPTLGTNVFNNNASGRKIYVPAASVDTYKAASGWSTYASDIEAIPTT